MREKTRAIRQEKREENRRTRKERREEVIHRATVRPAAVLSERTHAHPDDQLRQLAAQTGAQLRGQKKKPSFVQSILAVKTCVLFSICAFSS